MLADFDLSFMTSCKPQVRIHIPETKMVHLYKLLEILDPNEIHWCHTYPMIYSFDRKSNTQGFKSSLV